MGYDNWVRSSRRNRHNDEFNDSMITLDAETIPIKERDTLTISSAVSLIGTL
jgi:hypothetical protein